MSTSQTHPGPTQGPGWTATFAVAWMLSAAAPVFSQEDTLVRWYDVRALAMLDLPSPVGVDMRLHLASVFLAYPRPPSYDVPLEASFALDADECSQLVIDALGDDWPDRELFSDTRAGFLRIEGNGRTHAEVERILAELSGQLLRTIDLELFVLPSSAVPKQTRAVLSAAATESLLARIAPLEYASKAVSLGQSARLGGESFASLLHDYDVEVAQQGRAADPQVSVVKQGTFVGVRVQERLDGGFFVRVWGRRGLQTAPPRRLPLEYFASAPLELPSLSTMLAVGSAAIPEGGALLLGQDWNDNGVWLIRASRGSSGLREREGPSPFVPLGEITARPLVVEPPWLPRASPSGGVRIPINRLLSQLGGAASDPAASAEDVLEQLWDVREEFELGGSLLLLGDTLYVRGSEQLLAASTAAVRDLSAALAVSTVEIDVRAGQLELKLAQELVASASASELADQLDHRLVGTCRVGDSLLIVAGTESLFLQDHDVEIAQGTAIHDPIIGHLFEGISLWCRPTRADAGTFSTWIELELQVPARAMTTVPIPAWEPRNPEQTTEDPVPTGTFALTGTIELPATARAKVSTRVLLTEGQWTLVSCTPLAGTKLALITVAKATSLPSE